MSVDTTFKPIGATYLLAAASAAARIMPDGGSTTTTVRVYCRTAGYLTWGPLQTIAAAAAPVAAGTPNTMGFPVGVWYIEIPGNSWMRNDATGVFELTAGQGGIA